MIVHSRIRDLSIQHGIPITMPFSQAEKFRGLEWVAIVKIEIMGVGLYDGRGTGDSSDDARIRAIDQALSKAPLEADY